MKALPVAMLFARQHATAQKPAAASSHHAASRGSLASAGCACSANSCAGRSRRRRAISGRHAALLPSVASAATVAALRSPTRGSNPGGVASPAIVVSS
ncbi:MAG: hypothetical protein E6J87_26565, partial [Deltaproteobacteria bacterium]